MRRMLLVLTVGAMMAAMVVFAATPAMAKANGGNHNDGANRLNAAPEFIVVENDDVLDDVLDNDVLDNGDIDDIDDIGDDDVLDDIEDGDNISLSDLVLLEALD